MTRACDPATPRAVVVGGGFGGIAASLRLRAKGYDVLVLDRCERLGGRAQVFEKDGFRHDAGPTVITAPVLLEELFGLFGRRIEDYVRLVEPAPWYRFHFTDGETFDYGRSGLGLDREIARFNPRDVAGYAALVAESRRLYEVAYEQLADQPFHQVAAMASAVPDLLRLRAHRSVWQMVASHIRDDRLRQALSIQPLLVGGNPFDTTCIYGLIHSLEQRWGIHFAIGGTGALVDALARLMAETGIGTRLGTTVAAVVVRDGIATGVRLESGEVVDADLVVSDADPMHLYGAMIEPSAQTVAVRLKRRMAKLSMGLFVLFFGTSTRHPEVAHHTVRLGRHYRELLTDIFHRKVLSDDLSIYLHRPTATDPGFAPEGQDAFYALVPVPDTTAAIDWPEAGPQLHDRVLATLEQSLMPGLRRDVVSTFFMTPNDFEDRYLSVGGAGFSIAPLFRQSAWFRFHNRGEGPRNLYLVGAGTHPGAGLPGVLNSAKVLERLVPEATAFRGRGA